MKIQALKPLVCSVPCAVEQSNYQQTELASGEGGAIIKKMVAYRTFKMHPEIRRPATPLDVAADAGRVAAGGQSWLEGEGEHVTITEPASPPIEVPDDYGQSLIDRGLARAVEDAAVPASVAAGRMARPARPRSQASA